MSFWKSKTKKFSTVNYNITLGLEKSTPFDGFHYENKTQESANENERRKYCLTPGKKSLKEDGQEFLFTMQPFSLSRPIDSAQMLVSVRRLVGSTQALVSMSSHRLVLVSQGWSVGAVAILRKHQRRQKN